MTDILYDLGLGENLIGVTSWCILPQGDEKPVIGSETIVNTEALLSLGPDLIFIQQDPSRFDPLKRQDPDVRVISVKHDSVEGIFESIRTIGEAAGVADRAAELSGKIRARLDLVRSRVRGRGRPGVLFVMGYDHPGTCGRDTYLDQIIWIAGGLNVAAEKYRRWPTINAETVLALKPDVLICHTNPNEVEEARKYWLNLQSLPAAAQGRVHITTDRRMTIFGSRVAAVAEQFATWIHGPPAETPASAPAGKGTSR